VNVQPSELDGPSARHLLRARDVIDPRYADPLGVAAWRRWRRWRAAVLDVALEVGFGSAAAFSAPSGT
jgi:hypothetical protein